MSNMSYCRFENTYGDLRDCVKALKENRLEDLSDRERKFAEWIKDLCKEYLELTETEEEDAEI